VGFLPVSTYPQQLAGATIPGNLTIAGLVSAKQARFVPGTVPAVVTGQETLVVGAPAGTTIATARICDDPANPRSVVNANFIEVTDHLNQPIEATPPSGGPKAFGDFMGCWNQIATVSSQFTPWFGIQTGGPAGATMYSGAGAPLPAAIVTALGTYAQVANVGDVYLQTDATGNPLWVCTVAGTSGARGGTWAQPYLPLTGGTVNGNLVVGGVSSMSAGGGYFTAFGSVDVQLAGQGLKVAEGANAKQGTAVLVAGTKVVANTAVTANSRILLTSQADGGTPGFLRVSARTAGTSFTVTSSNAADTSTFAYEIFEPG